MRHFLTHESLFLGFQMRSIFAGRCGMRVFLRDFRAQVVQRATTRIAISQETADYEVFLHMLRGVVARYCISVPAYVLRTNPFHLIPPPANERSLPGGMQHLGTAY